MEAGDGWRCGIVDDRGPESRDSLDDGPTCGDTGAFGGIKECGRADVLSWACWAGGDGMGPSEFFLRMLDAEGLPALTQD